MGAMYRLKAYFGMVPAEDMAEYADEPPGSATAAAAGSTRATAGATASTPATVSTPPSGSRGRIARRPGR